MMFVSFDPEIESLVGYLGNAREYLDLMLEFSGDDTEIVHGSQAYSMKANWKPLVENSMDGYHAIPPTSASLISTCPILGWTRRAGPAPTVSRVSAWRSAAAMRSSKTGRSRCQSPAP
jgi:hypothetical protein